MVLKVKGDVVNLGVQLLKVGKDLIGNRHQRLLPWQSVVDRVVNALETIFHRADDVVVEPFPNPEDRTADKQGACNRSEQGAPMVYRGCQHSLRLRGKEVAERHAGSVERLVREPCFHVLGWDRRSVDGDGRGNEPRTIGLVLRCKGSVRHGLPFREEEGC